MKKIIRKILLFLLKKIKVPPYSPKDVENITSFLESLFKVYIPSTQVSFVTATVNNNSIDLDYSINTVMGTFYICVRYPVPATPTTPITNAVLLSKGNDEIPFKQLMQMSASFTAPYIDFESRKKSNLLVLLRDLP